MTKNSNSRSLTDFQDLPDDIAGFVDHLDLSPEQLEQLDWVHRNDWEPGDPCPDCGSTFHAQYFVETEFLNARDDGSYQFEAGGDRADTLGYVCGDCETELYVHPVLALLFS